MDFNSHEITFSDSFDSNNIADFSSLVEDGSIGAEEGVLHEVAAGAHGDADVKDLFESVK